MKVSIVVPCKNEEFHIAHGVQIGRNSMIIANCMIAGSVIIVKSSWIAPSLSILNKVVIEENVTVGLGAVVLKNVPKGDVIVGNPGRKLNK